VYNIFFLIDHYFPYFVHDILVLDLLPSVRTLRGQKDSRGQGRRKARHSDYLLLKVDSELSISGDAANFITTT
jgi:hypothetical protein